MREQTPLTDAKLLTVSPANGVYPTAFYNRQGYTERPNGIVDADEMRELEREINRLRSEIERSKSHN